MGETLGTLRRKLKTLGTRHPRWLRGWKVHEGPPGVFLNAYRVTAVDASGAEFGFYVGGAGWPEMAEQMANELAQLLNAVSGTPSPEEQT
jgi:hypothetical protein